MLRESLGLARTKQDAPGSQSEARGASGGNWVAPAVARRCPLRVPMPRRSRALQPSLEIALCAASGRNCEHRNPVRVGMASATTMSALDPVRPPLFPGRRQTPPAPRFTNDAAETSRRRCRFWSGRGGVLGRVAVRRDAGPSLGEARGHHSRADSTRPIQRQDPRRERGDSPAMLRAGGPLPSLP
jgi:hypothetical protein